MKSGVKDKVLLEKISLPVEGMTCASCVARVEKAITKVEGVRNVSVNLASEKATFEFEPGKVNLNDVAEQVESAGYKIHLESKKKNDNIIIEIPAEKNEYEKKLKKDLIFSLILTIPILIINMGMMWFDTEAPHHGISQTTDYLNKILFLLTTPLIFISGKRFFVIFWKNLKHFTADMNSLVAVGTGSAYLYSSFIALFPDLIIKAGELPHVYFDTTAVIITLILMGRWLESRAKSKANASIKMLMDLQPKKTIIKVDNSEREVKLEDLKLNDVVVIKPGSKIPADGIITFGNSFVDESMISGESIPVEKNIGSKVIGGTLNKTGYFEFRITAIGDNSVLGQIIKMVEEAQGSKAPIQNLADKVASVFVPVVIAVAFVTLLFWIFYSGEFDYALINFVAVLIIACPCALGLATPTAIMSGTGKGAQLGILFKNGESLEQLHKISSIIFDKTGTITEGKPKVTYLIAKNISEEELLRLTASAEMGSEHPLAEAILNFAKKNDINFNQPDSFESVPGKGIIANIEGENIIAGSLNLITDNLIDISGFENEIEKLDSSGGSLVYTAINGKLKGIFVIEDPVKADSAKAINELNEMGINTIMLTGDNRKTAGIVAKNININEFEAEVLPQDKAAVVKKYQNKNEVVAMVGDGINDAPALAQSDVGIAIGKGTDVAIETGSVVLMNDDLTSVVSAIKLSKKTIKIIKQNLFWAFIYNVIGIPLAAFGLLNPMFGALAMSLSSVSVISNSLRLKNFKS